MTRFAALLAASLVPALAHSQDIAVVLQECRESTRGIMTVDYESTTRYDSGQETYCSVVRDGDMLRVDRKDLSPPVLNGKALKGVNAVVVFDGSRHSTIRDGTSVQLISDGAPPVYVVEPWAFAFMWLGARLDATRSEMLSDDVWKSVAKRFTGNSWHDIVGGQVCVIGEFKSAGSDDYYEVSFAESLGFLPVLVRRFVPGDPEPSSVSRIYNHVKFDLDGRLAWYPRSLEYRESGRDGISTKQRFVSNIVENSLAVNEPVDGGLFVIASDAALLRIDQDEVARRIGTSLENIPPQPFSTRRGLLMPLFLLLLFIGIACLLVVARRQLR